MKKIFIISSLLSLLFLVSACGPAKPAVSPAAAPAGLTMAVVADHNTADDCWLVDNNNIYNATDYLAGHPDEEPAIIPLCGKDATANFSAKETGLGAAHSDAARQTLEQYYIGSLTR